MYNEIDILNEQLRRCELLTESEVKSVCDKAREILIEEGNIQEVHSPVTVVFE